MYKVDKESNFQYIKIYDPHFVVLFFIYNEVLRMMDKEHFELWDIPVVICRHLTTTK